LKIAFDKKIGRISQILLQEAQSLNYFFLCVTQYFVFPVAGFLHFSPFVVFAAQVAFLTVAIFSPFL